MVVTLGRRITWHDTGTESGGLHHQLELRTLPSELQGVIYLTVAVNSWARTRPWFAPQAIPEQKEATA
jgi:hypothetical protein